MAPVIIANDVIARLIYESAMDSSHITTLQILGISKQANKIHIFPKIKTSLLISLGLLCGDGCTITLDKKDMAVQKNVQEIIKGTRNKQSSIWEVTLETQQSEAVANNILAQTTKPELSQYLHVALFSPKTASLLKSIKQGFLKTWPGLKENLVKNHLEKSRNTTMVDLYMRI